MAAAEDGEKASADSPPRIRVRIESLSDLVFGLALSVGSLILVGRIPQSGQDLALNVLLFGFGFLILVATWLGYSRTMAVLPVEVPFALVVNIVLLFIVALEPYLFYVLTDRPNSGLGRRSIRRIRPRRRRDVPHAGGAGLHGIEGVKRLGQHPLHPVLLARFRMVTRSSAVVGLVFVVSALPIFWVNTPIGYLRFYLWSSSFLMFSLFLRRPRAK